MRYFNNSLIWMKSEEFWEFNTVQRAGSSARKVRLNQMVNYEMWVGQIREHTPFRGIQNIYKSPVPNHK